MNRPYVFAIALTLAFAPVSAQDGLDAEAKAHVERHRKMAQIHADAAACLESGKSMKECGTQLVKACKGLASGPHCGMKH